MVSLTARPSGFNSRTLGRVRQNADSYLCHSCSSFNSRTLGRVRLANSTTFLGLKGFNSRTLGRVRLRRLVLPPLTLLVSIHAPWEGCDAFEPTLTIPIDVSIHAPWEGCDRERTTPGARDTVSIHAPWEGCDRVRKISTSSIRSFNSRTLGRVRP